MINKEKLKQHLKVELQNLTKSADILYKSYDSCKNIVYPFNFLENEKVDALTIRLARSSDIYTQKILTSVLLLQKEQVDGFLDKVNICEKLGIIESATDLGHIRDLRNSVTHDYEGDVVNRIFLDTMKYTPILLSNIDTTKQYLKKFDIN
jgi:hypothetical protein